MKCSQSVGNKIQWHDARSSTKVNDPLMTKARHTDECYSSIQSRFNCTQSIFCEDNALEK